MATDLALRMLQNGNGSYFPPWQFKLFSPTRYAKLHQFSLLEDTNLTSALKLGAETYGKFVNKYNSEDCTGRFGHKH